MDGLAGIVRTMNLNEVMEAGHLLRLTKEPLAWVLVRIDDVHESNERMAVMHGYYMGVFCKELLVNLTEESK